jgi:hypothetical protein
MTETMPLRLAVGSHQAGSGKGCAMNVISWENGDTTISDMPSCADPMLARIVQRVNDRHCTHRQGDMLCAPCSIEVLTLAFRTVGTMLPAGPERTRIWVTVAVDQARSVEHLNPDPRVKAANDATEAWLKIPTAANANAAYGAARAAYGAARAAADAAADAAYAAYAAAAAAAYDAHAAHAAAYAAAAYAANAANADRLLMAHSAIDLFQQLAGITEHTPNPTITAEAIHHMLQTA